MLSFAKVFNLVAILLVVLINEHNCVPVQGDLDFSEIQGLITTVLQMDGLQSVPDSIFIGESELSESSVQQTISLPVPAVPVETQNSTASIAVPVVTQNSTASNAITLSPPSVPVPSSTPSTPIDASFPYTSTVVIDVIQQYLQKRGLISSSLLDSSIATDVSIQLFNGNNNFSSLVNTLEDTLLDLGIITSKLVTVVATTANAVETVAVDAL